MMGPQAEVWQSLDPPGARPAGVQPDNATYAAALPDGRLILLPIRVLPGGTDRAVASLIVNQASFAVLDALADALAGAVRDCGATLVVGLPTLGLTLAEAVARRLGHARMLPLGTSPKFWYDAALSEPIRSITTPDARRLFIDPRMLPLLAGARVLLVDDVISTGTSITAALRLLARVGVVPVAIAAAMLQGGAWRMPVAAAAPDVPLFSAIATPLLTRTGSGWGAAV